MFFIMGINDGRKDFDFTQTVICDSCGKYGRYQVFMLYTVLSLFFIPTFKWDRRYYVQMSCCGTVYELDLEIGKRIASGEELQIKPQDLTKISQDYDWTGKKVMAFATSGGSKIGKTAEKLQPYVNGAESVDAKLVY